MITPAYINELIDFYPYPPAEGWTFDPQGHDMRSQQVKGSAHLYNVLQREKIALLADEVGMGKTIQALSVMAALWRKKPEARVLIFAPRDEIARNWQREYENFIRLHYRHHDNIVKTVIGSEAVNPMVYCYNLYDLVDHVKQGWAKCYIGKISSFSNLQSRQNVKAILQDLGIRENSKLRAAEHHKERYTREIAGLLRDEINAQSNRRKPFFDLLIIDEAHYFRHKQGNSLRVNTANAFFGDPAGKDIPLAESVLLLTATPNHTSSDDIRNIVSYFSTRHASNSHEQILDELCVRRLRRLSSHAY
ncbi:MAG: DEAD/DEAH box helicase family protein, partial [Bacteroidota bacterium]